MFWRVDQDIPGGVDDSAALPTRCVTSVVMSPLETSRAVPGAGPLPGAQCEELLLALSANAHHARGTCKPRARVRTEACAGGGDEGLAAILTGSLGTHACDGSAFPRAVFLVAIPAVEHCTAPMAGNSGAPMRVRCARARAETLRDATRREDAAAVTLPWRSRAFPRSALRRAETLPRALRCVCRAAVDAWRDWSCSHVSLRIRSYRNDRTSVLHPQVPAQPRCGGAASSSSSATVGWGSGDFARRPEQSDRSAGGRARRA